MTKPVVELKGVSKAFGGVRVAQNTSLSLIPGVVVGLIGPNGAGKTSLFNLIAGQLRPDVGSVLIAGGDVTAKPVHVRASLGLSRTWQNIRLFPTLTVLENLLIGARDYPGASLTKTLLRRRLVQRHTGLATQRAMELLSLVDLSEYAHTLVTELSFGEQKLASIARALMNDGDCILLDEPMSGIDQGTYEKIRQLVRAAAQGGAAVCVVEHNVAFIRDLCDHAYFMAGGVIMAEGSVESLMARRDLTELYFGTIGSGV